MAKKNFYAVKVGRKCDVIVTTWDECDALVTGFPRAKFKGFPSKEEAQEWLDYLEVSRPPKLSELTSRPPPRPKTTNDVFNEKYPCTKRKDIVVNGKLHKNRCVERRGPRMIGENYVPSDDDSIPWDE